MRNIKIYQTENRDYVYMNWKWAEKYFNINDYKMVLEYDHENNLNDEELLEVIFAIGNNGVLHKAFADKRFRSISVSDVIELDGIKYFVDSFGFRKIGA